ncbi:hypothetical protein [Psychrobacter sp. D2]|uniref:hypothetical protein n=1 Tax=Psychrobacter sp. D2 TaxID=2759702 RepID=UPI0038F69C84
MKQNRRPIGMSSRYSRPSRARGLKPQLIGEGVDWVLFASITGAWIETITRYQNHL